MSTNSLVAVLNKDNTVTSSYVHYDGYTTGVGEMLLENYNSDELARELATTLGYASSLSETVAKSHEGSANSEEPETWEDFEGFVHYIRESSNLEYVYIWMDKHFTNEGHEWMVASWTNTKKKVHNGVCLDYEFDSSWNGFEELVTEYIREARETVKRYRSMVEENRIGGEYLDYADELETSIFKWRLTEDVKISEGLNV